MPRVVVGVGLLVGRPVGAVGGAGRVGFATVLVGFGDRLDSGALRFGCAAGALLPEARAEDDATGAPRSGVTAATGDALLAGDVPGDGEPDGALGDAEVLGWVDSAPGPPSGSSGVAAWCPGPGVRSSPEIAAIATAVAAAAPSTATAPVRRHPRPDPAARAGAERWRPADEVRLAIRAITASPAAASEHSRTSASTRAGAVRCRRCHPIDRNDAL